jgi:anti-sigma-K factor RskA
MQTPAQFRKLLLDYRLNRLSPAERESVEERMFREVEFSTQLEEAEYDLLDDYRHARLSPGDRARVEEAFSASERARALMLRAPAPVVRTPVRRAGFFSMPVLALSFGALLVAFALGLWLHGRQRPSPAVVTNVPKLPEIAAATPSPQIMATLLLTPEVTRDTSALQLVLTPQTDGVRVQWVLPSETRGDKFGLTVTTRSGTSVMSVGGEVSVVEGQRLVEFDLPAAELHPGEGYQFIVNDTHHTAVREYRVTVARR